MFLHGGCKSVIEQIRKCTLEALGDNVAHLLGVKAPVFQTYVATILDSGNDRRVGRRPANATLFQFPHQAGFTVARRRFGEVLFRVQLLKLQSLTHGNRRQLSLIGFPGHGRLHPREAVKLHDPTPCCEIIVPSRHRYGCRQIASGRHLAGHELTPDQLVESLCIPFHTLQLVLTDGDLRGPDRLVGLLGPVLGGIAQRRFGQVSRRKLAGDVLPAGCYRIVTQISRVGPHVGDVAGLVQALGQGHGFFDAKAQTGAGRLLQGRRYKGRSRLATGFPGLEVTDLKRGRFQGGDRRHRLGLIFGCKFLPGQVAHFKTHRRMTLGRQIGVYLPILLGYKSANFTLSLNNQTHGHRLHPSSRQAPGDFRPKQG